MIRIPDSNSCKTNWKIIPLTIKTYTYAQFELNENTLEMEMGIQRSQNYSVVTEIKILLKGLSN